MKRHITLSVSKPCDVRLVGGTNSKWKLDGKILSNQYGVTLSGTWELPTAGTPGTIQNTDTGDNGYLSTNGIIGSAVDEVALVGKDDSRLIQKQQSKKHSHSKINI